MIFDPYNELGVEKNATKEQIKKAYKKKVKKHHPDIGGDNEKFCSIGKAYAILIDDNYRNQYDKTGCTDTTPEENRINSAANDIIGMMIDTVMEQSDESIIFHNIIPGMIKHCQNNIGHGDKAIKNLKFKRRVANKIKSRMKYKGENIDVIGGVIENKLKTIEKNIYEIEFQSKINKRAIEILGHYVFEFDTRQPVVVTNTDTSTFTSGASWYTFRI